MAAPNHPSNPRSSRGSDEGHASKKVATGIGERKGKSSESGSNPRNWRGNEDMKVSEPGNRGKGAKEAHSMAEGLTSRARKNAGSVKSAPEDVRLPSQNDGTTPGRK